jgi:hypothetical protein
MTRSELLEVVYRFYPRGMHEFSSGYDDTVEAYNLREAARRGAAEYPTWRAMIRRLGDRYSLMDHSVCLLAGWREPAYSAQIWIPERTLYFHMSLLGPYYAVKRTDAPEEEPAALDLAREIEATYRGYEPILPEFGNEVVPDVGCFGKETIYRCLFSSFWEYDSGPWPPPPPPPPPPPSPEDLARIARACRSGHVFIALEGRPLDEPSKEDDEPGRGR